MDIKPREMMMDPILPVQGLAMIHAKRGVGKTHIALGIGVAVASGKDFLRWKAPKPRKVLFVDGELPASVLKSEIVRQKVYLIKLSFEGRAKLLMHETRNDYLEPSNHSTEQILLRSLGVVLCVPTVLLDGANCAD
jgi:putative DNA primase/helicase